MPDCADRRQSSCRLHYRTGIAHTIRDSCFRLVFRQASELPAKAGEARGVSRRFQPPPRFRRRPECTVDFPQAACAESWGEMSGAKGAACRKT